MEISDCCFCSASEAICSSKEPQKITEAWRELNKTLKVDAFAIGLFPYYQEFRDFSQPINMARDGIPDELAIDYYLAKMPGKDYAAKAVYSNKPQVWWASENSPPADAYLFGKYGFYSGLYIPSVIGHSYAILSLFAKTRPVGIDMTPFSSRLKRTLNNTHQKIISDFYDHFSPYTYKPSKQIIDTFNLIEKGFKYRDIARLRGVSEQAIKELVKATKTELYPEASEIDGKDIAKKLHYAKYF